MTVVPPTKLWQTKASADTAKCPWSEITLSWLLLASMTLILPTLWWFPISLSVNAKVQVLNGLYSSTWPGHLLYHPLISLTSSASAFFSFMLLQLNWLFSSHFYFRGFVLTLPSALISAWLIPSIPSGLCSNSILPIRTILVILFYTTTCPFLTVLLILTVLFYFHRTYHLATC